jgi:hypothetical protein
MIQFFCVWKTLGCSIWQLSFSQQLAARQNVSDKPATSVTRLLSPRQRNQVPPPLPIYGASYLHFLAKTKLPHKTGHCPHSIGELCCSYVLFVSTVLFYVLFVCKRVLYYCHRVVTQLLLNIYRIILEHGSLGLQMQTKDSAHYNSSHTKLEHTEYSINQSQYMIW